MSERYKGFIENTNYVKDISPAYFKTWDTEGNILSHQEIHKQVETTGNTDGQILSSYNFLSSGNNTQIIVENLPGRKITKKNLSEAGGNRDHHNF